MSDLEIKQTVNKSMLRSMCNHLSPDEVELAIAYVTRLYESRPKQEDPARSHTYHYSESEKLQDQLEPLPGVPRYSKVVVG